MKIVNPILYEQLINITEQNYQGSEDTNENTEQISNKAE